MHDWVYGYRGGGGAARYAATVGLVAAAALATWLLHDALHHTVTPLFIVAVALATLIGGLRAGLLAIALSLPAVAALVFGAELGLRHELWTGGLLLAVLLAAAEGGRRQSLQVLIERYRRLRLVTEQIPAALWSTDGQLRLSTRFGAARSLFGAPLGTSLTELFPGAGDEYPPIAAHLRALRGEPSTFELEWEGRMFQAHVEPLQNAGGEVVGVIGVALDISERKRGELRVEQARADAERARAEAERATHARDRFLAVLSHELRTPLTPAVMTVAAVAGRADLPAGAREDLDLARRNIELEARLIDDLLDVTRVASGKLKLDRRPADAHAVLRHAADVCRGEAAERQVGLALDLTAPRHHVHADAARLQQVFWNLIKNAVKFTPPGGRVRVRTANARDAGEGSESGEGGESGEGAELLVVEVSDTGVGIAPHALPRIFEPFEQGDASTTRAFGGLGLGLAISRALVEGHDGRLTAASEGAGRGATFRVELRASEAEVPPDPPPGPADPPDVRRRSLRVLLVEDHADTRRVLARLLRSAGHSVTAAETVAAARDAIAIAAPGDAAEVLVSDLALPDGTGLDVVRALRELRPGCRVAAIALSGWGMEEDVRRSIDGGFDGHLTKPVSLEQLLHLIEELAGRPPAVAPGGVPDADDGALRP